MADTSMALTVVPENGVDTYRTSTNAATICGEIVKATAQNIQGRKYVRCEGWQAIAVAHGCTASATHIERVEGGFRATGQVRRMDTGAIIAEAEGFVGEDEPTWFGGKTAGGKVLPKRPDFAIRAMAQTRAISRACRSAFAHVVVMIDRSLGTTPAEEMQGVYEHETSWGPGGKEGAVAQAEADGLMAHAPKVTAAKLAAAEKWVDNAVQTLNLSAHTKESLAGFWSDNSEKIDALEEKLPKLHEKLLTAYDAAMERVAAKAA